MSAAPPRRRLLVVGGLGGQLGRALAPELLPDFEVRSVHRHRAESEPASVDWRPIDASAITDWRPLVDGCDAAVILAWHRAGPRRRFERLGASLRSLASEARAAGLRRIVHVSVPPAPPSLESRLPYLIEKRAVDAAVIGSGVEYRVVRPSALFGPGDVLLGVMMATIWRYGRLPLFEDGSTHLSPISSADVARAIRLALDAPGSSDRTLGGPERLTYRELADRMFHALGRPGRYWRFSGRGGIRFARLLELLGSTRLYAYEVEWLLSDLLGPPPFDGLDRPLTPVGPYLSGCAQRLTGRAS